MSKIDFEKQKALKDNYTKRLEKVSRILNGISYRSINMEKQKIVREPFDDLYPLLSKKELLIQAYGNINRNKGSMTKGVDDDIADSTSLTSLENLALEIKNKTFKFSRIRRQWIPKQKVYKFGESKKMRPLGIPTFTDKIVQEAIRMILHAIYEPSFKEIEYNYGFRPSYGCHHPIFYIKKYVSAANIAIEGDIEGAYDNVDHDILINILRKKIKDEDFLQIIKQGFKSGILEQGKNYDTLSGVPQGGIASPILFNIYMHEFDKFIYNDLNQMIIEINEKEGSLFFL